MIIRKSIQCVTIQILNMELSRLEHIHDKVEALIFMVSDMTNPCPRGCLRTWTHRGEFHGHSLIRNIDIRISLDIKS